MTNAKITAPAFFSRLGEKLIKTSSITESIARFAVKHPNWESTLEEVLQKAKSKAKKTIIEEVLSKKEEEPLEVPAAPQEVLPAIPVTPDIPA